MAEPVFHFRDFRLDRKVLEHRGTVVPLAPKALDLLYLLVERAPETLSKEEIFDAVWPGTFVVESSLTRNISVVRKALEERGEGPFIETLPKRGYRFVAPFDVPGAVATPLAPTAVTAPRRLRNPWWLFALCLPVLAGGTWYMTRNHVVPAQSSEAAQIGRSLMLKGTPAQARQALLWMERAVKENPDSAETQAGLAEALLALPALGVGAQQEGYPRALAAAQTAVRLDGGHAQAHAVLGIAQMDVEWDFPSAERSLRRALSLDPANATAVVYLARLLMREQRLTDARALAEEGIRRHPLVPMLGLARGRISYYQGDYVRAERELREVLEREPKFALAHHQLSLTYGWLRRFPEAEQHLAQADLNAAVLRADQAWLKLREGDRVPAEEEYAISTQAVEQGKAGPEARLFLATALGHHDVAFSALNTLLRERRPHVFQVRLDPRFAALRRDPRFAEIERRLRELMQR